MFENTDEICQKIEDSECISANELQIVEMALKMLDLYEEMLDQSLGLDKFTGEQLEIDFKLAHSLHRNC